ncbi:RibD family protein [Roseibacterium beibuensis]|uniref:RibD family protein n=1 Tax=[Roseibacterium] beibuensis TaxID=1193142 RepID=UPI00217F20B5|nr:RibD family protein [Roseibacterium beibuensis]MCS6625189.1 RibD family protein [Roseibacterium beibuensis]
MRPRVTLKLATSLDGRIATASGESQWITGEAARAEGHRLRASHDAILIGVGTALADDPLLTVRQPGLEHRQPVRVVLDSRQRLSPGSKLALTARESPVIVLTVQLPAPALVRAGVEVIQVHAGRDGRPSLTHVLTALRGRGLISLLVEGGGEVAASFLRCDAVDRLEWFRAPILLGAEGRPCVGTLAVEELGQARRFRRLAAEPCGDDLWERYERL